MSGNIVKSLEEFVRSDSNESNFTVKTNKI